MKGEIGFGGPFK